MNSEDMDAVVRERMKQQGFGEVRRILGEYRCCRQTESGGVQDVWLRIEDLGPSMPNGRYYWSVWIPTAAEQKLEGDRVCVTANGASSIEGAGAVVQWRLLKSWLDKQSEE